jgi:hypothetical protein
VALVFSAGGVRWSVKIIEANDPDGRRPGLLFSSVEGDDRFLALAPFSLPSLEQLATMTTAELGGMAARALPVGDA